MSVQGKIEDPDTLRLRVAVGSGTLGKHTFHVSTNVDGKAFFVEFKGCPFVAYKTSDMVKDAYDLLKKGGFLG